ncbi:MAG TPA: AAA family ATPase [Candidatus Limnocylindrales bacterium]|nr:AAA family ATPase [Candidatus Limnocylindrales bacterium]
MFLKSLQLLGFKTFARQTEIQFDGGVTAIVGPNGSGKTNIVDSVKWVLGSGQARDLRGKKMEEVIYAGGERRSRAAYAEVTLVFDNSAGRLPLDYHEVAIKRRIERDGESDYYINGSRVRRRDLIHLLSSTGLTVDSYAIIDQHDIEHIVVCSPAERRQLLEEAAQVRGVKQRRQEALQKLQELAANLLRLEDLKTELAPRLEVLRTQAAAAREAAEATARLELLRGSIVWEEWREARDAHRRASSQAQSLERRLIEAREQARTAEDEFQAGRAAMQAAQDRRLARQRTLGQLRLQLSEAEHRQQLGEERAENRRAVADSARRSEAESRALLEAAAALGTQLAAELSQAEKSIASPAESVVAVAEPDSASARDARHAAERARRAAVVAASSLAGVRSRREFLEEQAARVSEATEAAAHLAGAEVAVRDAEAEARAAQDAATALARLRAELEGIDALRPASADGMRLGEIITPEPGYEKALSAALGPLVDAVVVKDEAAALRSVAEADQQVTAVYPVDAPEPRWDSLYHHVRVRDGFDAIARRLLGRAVVDRGIYREPGLVRGGADPRTALDARRAHLRREIAGMEGRAASRESAETTLREARHAFEGLRVQAAEAARSEEVARLLEAARAGERTAADELGRLEAEAGAAETHAAELSSELEARLREVAEQRAMQQQRELDRKRWHERIDSLRRQNTLVDEDVTRLTAALEDRATQLVEAERAAAAAVATLPDLRQAADDARQALASAEHDAPEDEAEMAESARRLVALEEARIDARLRTGTLEGNLELVAREAELLQARMDEIRGRMPDGVAPEEVPGGKAREREMRALERRLEEIGPTNALAESEFRELEERYQNLAEQLDDITAARADLEDLISQLRQEEESRYEAVFGAVAANFHEYFAELNPGGRATLRHADGDDGPRSGVEILVQPPRKRLQNVTLLSSGERSLAALALVLALDEVNPSPFTILDEVDAALDDANVDRFGKMVARLGAERQFLVITHNHVTMSYASTLYGIHLDESGSSHLVSVRLEDIRKPAARAATTLQAG